MIAASGSSGCSSALSHGVRNARLLTRENALGQRAALQRGTGTDRYRLAVIDAIDCARALTRAAATPPPTRMQGADGHYGIGALTSVTILADSATSAFSSSRAVSATPAWTSPSTPPTSAARPTPLPPTRPPYAGRYMTAQPQAATFPAPRLLPASTGRSAQPRLPRARAQAAQTLLPHPQRPRRTRTRARMSSPRARTPEPQADAPPTPGMRAATLAWTASKDERRSAPSENPITIMSPTRSQPEV